MLSVLIVLSLHRPSCCSLCPLMLPLPVSMLAADCQSNGGNSEQSAHALSLLPPPFLASLPHQSSQSTFFRRAIKMKTQPSGIAAHLSSIQTITYNLNRLAPNARAFFLSYPPSHTPSTFQYAGTTCSTFATPLNNHALSIALVRNPAADWTGSEQVALRTSKMTFLNVLQMTLYRADGHVGIYGVPRGVNLDCTGWCLPGVPDSWLDVFYHQYIQKYGIKG